MLIIDTVTNPCQVQTSFEQVYIRDQNVCIYIGHDYSYLIDLTNAQKRGKTCARHTRSYDKLDFLNDRTIDYKNLLATFCGKIDNEREESFRTFSPFFVHKGKIDNAPKTVAGAVKVLQSGNFQLVHCNYKYTDDYAFDAAYGFGAGSLQPMQVQYLIKRMVESPKWFNVYSESGEIGIYNSNDSYTITV